MLPCADDDATSTPRSCTVLDLRGDRGDPLGVGPVVQRAHQRLAGELEQDALEDRATHRRRTA
jgi:hypothetical protein